MNQDLNRLWVESIRPILLGFFQLSPIWKWSHWQVISSFQTGRILFSRRLLPSYEKESRTALVCLLVPVCQSCPSAVRALPGPGSGLTGVLLHSLRNVQALPGSGSPGFTASL